MIIWDLFVSELPAKSRRVFMGNVAHAINIAKNCSESDGWDAFSGEDLEHVLMLKKMPDRGMLSGESFYLTVKRKH